MRLNSIRLWCELSLPGIALLSALPTAAVPCVACSSATYTVPTVVAQNLPAGGNADPNRDRFLQPSTPPSPAPITPETSPLQTPPTPTPTPSPTPETDNPRIEVKRIEVTGNTVLPPGEIQAITSKAEGKTLTLEELRNVADAITQLYLNRGFITSRAVLVDQTITNGLVQIRAIEGRIAQIDIEGLQHLNPDYIRSRIALAGLYPFSKDRLEDQLRLLRTDPLFENIEASLRPGTQLGESILVVRATEADPVNWSINLDNYSPPSVGGERMGVGFSHRDLLGLGDQLSLGYTRTLTGGSNLYDFSYRIPVNPRNGTLQIRYAPSNYHITDPNFVSFGITGNTDLYEISFRQPIIRTPREELGLSLGLTHQSGQTFLFNDQPTPFGIGPDANGVSRTTVLKFSQDYLSRDPGGAWSLRSQFSLGLGLFNATINPDPIPDSQFLSWLGQVQRVQLLNSDHLLLIQGDLQLSANSLLPSQQFVIGGGQSVRGFRQNARSGDNGFRFSVEDRITIQRDESGASILQLAPFIDLGAIWNTGNNPNLLPNQTFLAGAGLGLIWEPLPRFNVRLDYAAPLVFLSDRGNNLQDNALYFSINYQP